VAEACCLCRYWNAVEDRQIGLTGYLASSSVLSWLEAVLWGGRSKGEAPDLRPLFQAALEGCSQKSSHAGSSGEGPSICSGNIATISSLSWHALHSPCKTGLQQNTVWPCDFEIISSFLVHEDRSAEARDNLHQDQPYGFIPQGSAMFNSPDSGRTVITFDPFWACPGTAHMSAQREVPDEGATSTISLTRSASGRRSLLQPTTAHASLADNARVCSLLLNTLT